MHEYFYSFVRSEMLTDDRGARRGGRGREDDFGDFSSMRRDRDDRGGGGRERDRYDDRPPRRSGFS